MLNYTTGQLSITPFRCSGSLFNSAVVLKRQSWQKTHGTKGKHWGHMSQGWTGLGPITKIITPSCSTTHFRYTLISRTPVTNASIIAKYSSCAVHPGILHPDVPASCQLVLHQCHLRNCHWSVTSVKLWCKKDVQVTQGRWQLTMEQL